MKNLFIQTLSVLAFLFVVLEANAQEIPQCTLRSEGLAGAEWKKHRLALGDEVVFGSNDLGELIEQLDLYRASGRCQ